MDRSIPKNPKSNNQLAVRLAFKKAAQQWKTLSITQKSAWASYGKYLNERNGASGKQFKLTGFNWFVKFNAKYFAVNPTSTSAPTTPPATDFTGDTAKITVTAGTGSIVFTANAANAAKVTTALLLQPLRYSTSTPNPEGYRTNKYVQFTSGSLTSTITVPIGYYAVGYQFVNTDTGQETEPVILSTVGPVTFAATGTDSGTKKKAA